MSYIWIPFIMFGIVFVIVFIGVLVSIIKSSKSKFKDVNGDGKVDHLDVFSNLTNQINIINQNIQNDSKPKTKKCPYCDSFIDIKLSTCPNCGAFLGEGE